MGRRVENRLFELNLKNQFINRHFVWVCVCVWGGGVFVGTFPTDPTERSGDGMIRDGENVVTFN
jgi:hypothetical protein